MTVRDVCYLPNAAGALLLLTPDLRQEMRADCWGLQHCSGTASQKETKVCFTSMEKKEKMEIPGEIVRCGIPAFSQQGLLHWPHAASPRPRAMEG